MNKILYTFFLSLFVVISSIAQSNDNELIEKVQKKAINMVEAFQKKDYNTFLNLTHPKIISLSGGKEKMIEMLKEGLGPDIEILNVEIFNPSKIIRSGNTQQCSFSQKQTLSINGQKIYTIGSLIGISYDNGENWSFIGVASNTLEKLKIHFPELNDELNVNPQSKPILIEK